MKVLIAQLNPTIGDYKGNTQKILDAITHAKAEGADLLVTSELAICGYPPDDLLLVSSFVEACEKSLQTIVKASTGLSIVVGTLRPCKGDKPLHNSAAVISDGKLLGYQDKSLLPTYDIFDEQRYFEPATDSQIWTLGGKKVAITICEDIWAKSEEFTYTRYHCDPIERFTSPDLLLNLSASPFSYGKINIRKKLVQRVVKELGCPAIYCNQVGGNDSLIFDGHSFAMNPAGEIIAEAKGFEEELLLFDTEKKAVPHDFHHDPLEEIFHALVLGLRDYFHKSGFHKAVLGLSGGIDSALVACIAVEALGPKNLLGVSMPSRFSTDHSKTDAFELAKNLGIECITIPIETIFVNYEGLLLPHFQNKPFDATEENLQARIRGMILMALSNKLGHIVLSTGNKSEMALGYATLYGDMAGGLGVINDVLKTQVYELCHWINQKKQWIPESTLSKPPSAELRAGQLDTDTLPDYKIIDSILEDYVERHIDPQTIALNHNYDEALVQSLITKIHRNEYKRRQAPPGLRISKKAFSIGRRFPIVQKWQ